MFKHTIDASGLDTNTWYPVIMPIGAFNTVRIEVRVSLNSDTRPSWSTHSSKGFSVRKIWEVNGSGWDINRINRRILESDYSYASTDPVRGIGQLGNSSTEYVYVRGGGKYYFYTSHNVPCTLCTTTYTIYSQSVEPTTTTPQDININVGYYCSNAGNASNADYAAYLRGRDGNGVYFGKEASSNIIAEWNTKSDNRWYLKAASTNQCRVEYADKASEANKVSWSNIENKPVDTIGDASLVIQVNGTQITPEGGNFTANKSGVPSIYNISIGNGRLILKNGNTIISDNFTANKGDDTTIDLNSAFTNKSDFELLGSKVDKIDTSITKLNNAMQVDNPFNDPENGNEDDIEITDNSYEDAKQLGSITLKFWNIATYTLPVYDVSVLPLATVKEPGGTLSYYCEIFLVIGITGYSIADEVGFTPGNYKPFFIRGANSKNNICDFDIRGNGNTNTANACITGNYLHLQCSLKLHGGDSGTGNDIMQKAANEQFNAYLCLRQTP